MSEEAKWYVIHTYSGYENKVAQTIEKVVENRKLQELIPEVRVPTETALEKKDNKTKEVERKVFPGYVLVKMVLTDDSWYVVRNVRGVTGFVGPASKPIFLTDEEVEKLARLESKTPTLEVGFRVGDTVEVSGGKMAGMTGKVQRIDVEKQEVDVLLLFFGRETLATLDLLNVTPVERAY